MESPVIFYVCAVIDNVTGVQVNTIIANTGEPAPDGCRLVELPDGYVWNGTEMVPMPAPVEETQVEENPVEVSSGN